MINTLVKMLAPLQRRVMLMVAPASINGVDDKAAIQKVQITLGQGEVRDHVNRIQHYGLTSHPHTESECVVVFVGGNRDHGLVIAVDDSRHRLTKLKPGEVALYTDEGDVIHLKRGNKIDIKSASTIILNAPDTQIIGNVTLEGDITIKGKMTIDGAITSSDMITDSVGSMQAMRIIYNGHTHGPTPPPSPSMS